MGTSIARNARTGQLIADTHWRVACAAFLLRGRGKRMKTVEAGAAFLDKRRPGWDRLIDLDTLDMGDPRNCVLGQLYGIIYAAIIGVFVDDEERLGFEGNYAVLTADWKRLIRERRGDVWHPLDTKAGPTR
jgi:hypothetical protein